MIYLIVTSLIWAFSFPLIKTYLSHLDSSWVSTVRLGISMIVFLPLLRPGKNKSALKQVAIGAIQFGLMYVLYIESYHYLKAHQIALLTITTPLFVVFFNGILTHKWSTSYWWAVFFVVLGSALLVPWKVAGITLTGILLVQAANACFAFGQILQKKWRSPSLHRVMGWSYLGGVMVPLVLLLFRHGIGGDPLGPLLHLTLRQFLVLIYLGSVASGLGFFMWNKGVCHINAGKVSIMNNLKIPLAVLVSFIWFAESVDWLRLGLSALCFAMAFKKVYKL